MNTNELNDYLFKITDSEEYHLAHPNCLSRRYVEIPFEILDGEKIYDFSFDSLMKDRQIAVKKESRFTWIPKHRHKVIELNYVYSGTCTQIIEGRKVVLNKGDVCLLDRNVRHSIETIEENDIIITVGMRKQYLIDKLLTRISSQGIVAHFFVDAIKDDTINKQFVVFRNKDDILNTLFQGLMCEYFSEDISNEVIDSYMTIIFTQLLRIYRQNSDSQYNSTESALIIDILQYIDVNYLTVNLSSLSKVFSYTPNYISNYIKQQTGTTFKELVIQKKLSNAAFFLSNTDIPIYEIAQDIGYNNLGFFYKKFRDYYGVNPNDYRNNHTTQS